MDAFVYIGTYTGPQKGRGIYLSRFDTVTGKLTPPELAIEAEQPSFLALHPTQRFLYAVGETNEWNGKSGGSVSGFSIRPTDGKLVLLNQVSSIGEGPCHLAVDRQGGYVAVGNYVGGSVAVIAIQPNGYLGESTAFVQHTGSSVNQVRQKGPHVHSVNFAPDNRFLFSGDLGADKLFVYRFDPETGGLTVNDPAFVPVLPGAGARHFTFHPNGRFAYLLNELDNTVVAYEYDATKGQLAEQQIIRTIPDAYRETTYTSEILIHPTGKFLYNSNRGHDSLAIFKIDDEKGTLTRVAIQSTGGKWPRNFAMDPTGLWLLAANEYSDSIVVFRIDQATGGLIPTGDSVGVPAPACVKFVRGS